MSFFRSVLSHLIKNQDTRKTGAYRFLFLFAGIGDVALIVFSPSEQDVDGIVHDDGPLGGVLDGDGVAVVGFEVGGFSSFHGQAVGVDPGVVHGGHAGGRVDGHVAAGHGHGQPLFLPARSQEEPQVRHGGHELVPHVLQLADVKEVDHLPFHVHVVGPEDFGDVGVEVGEFGRGLEMHVQVHADDFELVEQFHVTVQLLPEVVVVEGREGDVEVVVVFGTLHGELRAVEKLDQNRPVPIVVRDLGQAAAGVHPSSSSSSVRSSSSIRDRVRHAAAADEFPRAPDASHSSYLRHELFLHHLSAPRRGHYGLGDLSLWRSGKTPFKYFVLFDDPDLEPVLAEGVIGRETVGKHHDVRLLKKFDRRLVLPAKEAAVLEILHQAADVFEVSVRPAKIENDDAFFFVGVRQILRVRVGEDGGVVFGEHQAGERRLPRSPFLVHVPVDFAPVRSRLGQHSVQFRLPFEKD